jgi:C4-dicarboxylate-specific signal transduction histidine kinase
VIVKSVGDIRGSDECKSWEAIMDSAPDVPGSESHPPPIESEVRKTGIRVVGDVPWGTHFYLFYETKEDLLDALVPYFKVGLESGEFCVWGVCEPLTAAEVKSALRRSVAGFDRYLQNHSIELLVAREFYLNGQELGLDRVVGKWNEKLAYALANGYAGLRLSANTAWLERKNWRAFNEYEGEVNDFIASRRALALCTYPLAGSAAAEILDVARTHQFAIARRNKDWEIVETSELKQAKAEIKKLNVELEQRVDQRTRQLTATNEELRKEIEERQRVQAALQQTQAQLAHVGRLTAMGELAASIAHEVGQPLTAIVTNGSFLMRRLASSTANLGDFRAAVEAVVADGKRASSVISRIRALLKKQDTEIAELDINDAIREVAALLSSEASRHRVVMRTDLAPGLPRVQGDRVQLQQVMVNLVMNAVDATRALPDGPREILIRSGKEAESVVVSVEDSGTGIDPEHLERIFEAFFTTKSHGIGMGLSISRSIIEGHGGKLSASRRAPHGAKFEFTLPTPS